MLSFLSIYYFMGFFFEYELTIPFLAMPAVFSNWVNWHALMLNALEICQFWYQLGVCHSAEKWPILLPSHIEKCNWPQLLCCWRWIHLDDTNSLISRDLQMVAMPDRIIVNSWSAHNLKSCKPSRPGVQLSGEWNWNPLFTFQALLLKGKASKQSKRVVWNANMRVPISLTFTRSLLLIACSISLECLEPGQYFWELHFFTILLL